MRIPRPRENVARQASESSVAASTSPPPISGSPGPPTSSMVTSSIVASVQSLTSPFPSATTHASHITLPPTTISMSLASPSHSDSSISQELFGKEESKASLVFKIVVPIIFFVLLVYACSPWGPCGSARRERNERIANLIHQERILATRRTTTFQTGGQRPGYELGVVRRLRTTSLPTYNEMAARDEVILGRGGCPPGWCEDGLDRRTSHASSVDVTDHTLSQARAQGSVADASPAKPPPPPFSERARSAASTPTPAPVSTSASPIPARTAAAGRSSMAFSEGAPSYQSHASHSPTRAG